MKKRKVNYLLEEIRKKGRNGDTILAHINPLEAMMLKKMGGSGTINPKTGLPEFFEMPRIFSHPFKTVTKAFKDPVHTAKRFIGNTVAPIGGAILGNMVAPGIGGVIGGGLMGGVGSKAIGKDFKSGAISGAALGAFLPTAASAAGWGANALGAKSLGTSLSDYGYNNGILNALGMGDDGTPWLSSSSGVGDYAKYGAASFGGNALLSKMYGADKNGSALENFERNNPTGVSAGDDDDNEPGFVETLGKNTKKYLSKPKNLLSLGSLAASIYDKNNKPKELTATQRGKAAKEEMLAMRLTPAEMAEQEQYELAIEQARRKNARKKFLPEERIDLAPLYNRVSTPQEYAQTGRWMNYYDNPRFTGQPIRF